MKLSVVATPIGNLEDITLRALRVLKEADIVCCEDTRMTKKLLSHYDIHTPTAMDTRVLSMLEQGKHVALVSDAGTPGVSDPGLEIVSKARDMGATIEVIPGPSALAAAISIAGLRVPTFTFYGFLPTKKGREKLFTEITASDRASIFYESPHRIMKALESLREHMEGSDSNYIGLPYVKKHVRRVGLFRELTKLYEDHIIGTPAELIEILTGDTHKQKGEFVVVVEAA